ncbi:agmatinase [Ovoidimarina sediminis]|uniref:agmatinase n=1 Tax=Ovoidimarina sediminis TaxID=3079856 RepID=UPI00290E836A|nr:agmatinase [Rhodophyticola sp. MJ-SS7]MDU8945663.1 agmatinase [Rhodophyticola sp. MJ-SS7]
MSLEDAKNEIDRAFTEETSRGLAFENAFAGATSFLRRRYTKDLTGVDLAITGIPFDQAVTNRPGTRLGPRAIREASSLQPFDPPYGWPFSPLEEFTIVDCGDLAFDYAKTPEFPGKLQAHIGGILSVGAGSIALGGDHSITLPILRAYAEKFGQLSVLQFDAHGDTWADDDPNRIDHGTFLYTAVKEGLVDDTTSVQVGIRTTNPEPLGFTIVDAQAVHTNGTARTLDIIRETLGDRPVYLTFDIDCLDPAFAPGTGTPVWGGLSSAQAVTLLQGLKGINMVGGDVVEVSPPFDHAAITAVAGAHVAHELVCLYCWNKR